jgi:hypothetical protein
MCLITGEEDYRSPRVRVCRHSGQHTTAERLSYRGWEDYDSGEDPLVARLCEMVLKIDFSSLQP